MTNFKVSRITLSLFFTLFIVLNLSAQNIDIKNMSDQQVKELVEQAGAQGYSINDIESYAQLRGLSAAQIIELRSRISQLNNGGQANLGTENPLPTDRNLTEPVAIAPATTLQGNSSNIFGSALFRTSQLSFSPILNIPTPKDYVLGAGDVVNIELWGKSEYNQSLSITPDGYIRPNSLGPIYVNGLTIEEATVRINKQLDRIYDGLIPDEGEEQSVFSLVTLGQLKTISVTILGEVALPGNYNLNSLSTVYTALFAAGGPNNNGTFREIELLRNNKIISKIDIYEFLIDGLKLDDKRLQSNDIILVRPYKKRITVNGEVKKPGEFELLPNEGAKALFKYTGGFTNLANIDQIYIRRSTTDNFKILNIDPDSTNFELLDGDIIQVRTSNKKFNNRVVIEGAVLNAGQYELKTDMTLEVLIETAGGLRKDAIKNRVSIFRIDENYSQQVLSYNLELASNAKSINLKPDDIVKIESIYNVSEEPYLRITGEVRNPGIFPFINGFTVKDLILSAGGVNKEASNNIEISRLVLEGSESIENKLLNLDLLDEQAVLSEVLQPFDQVFIRQKYSALNQEVRITGEVNSPGIYAIKPGEERISDVLKRANGTTPQAYPAGGFLIRLSEYSNLQSGFQLNREELNSLRQRIIESTGLNLSSKDELSQRIEQITSEFLQGLSVSQIGVSKKNLLTSSTLEIDTLSRVTLNFPDYEPITFDLEKIISSPGSQEDLFLRNGDILSIPTKLQTVRVTGEVVSNILIPYKDNLSFKDYINGSGGFLRSAKRSRSYVQYPNGERAGIKKFLFFKNFPKIEPGSTIVVAQKPPRPAINLSTAISSVGSLLTLVLLIDRISAN